MNEEESTRKINVYAGQFKLKDGQLGEVKIGAPNMVLAMIKAAAGLSEGPFESVEAIVIQRIEPSNIIMPENSRFTPPIEKG